MRDNSANWGAHTDIGPLTTLVSINSAGWAEKTDIGPLTTLISNNSGAWGAELGDEFTDMLTLVETNSASWNYINDIADRVDVFGDTITLVQQSSAYWNIKTNVDELTTTVQDNSASWASGGLEQLGTLYNLVSSFSGDWGNHTDVSDIVDTLNQTITDLFRIESDVDETNTLIQDNSAAWAIDTTDVDLRTIVEVNSADWATQTDITDVLIDIETIFDMISDPGSNEINVTDLYNFVRTYSASWSAQTDITSLTNDVETLSAKVTSDVEALSAEVHHIHDEHIPEIVASVTTNKDDIDYLYDFLNDSLTPAVNNNTVTINDYFWPLYNNVNSNSADWSAVYASVFANSSSWGEHTDITTLELASGGWNNVYTTVYTNSAGWGVHTDITDIEAASGGWDDTYTTVYTNSAGWGTHTDITELESSSGSWDEVYNTVYANSASWATGSGGGTGGGSAGAFMTNITCGGIANITEDSDEIQVDGERPVLGAVVDDSTVTFHVQWEGSSTEWTGTPTVSGWEIPRANTTAIGGNFARRFEGHVTLDLEEFAGTTTDIYYDYEGVQKEVELQIAGGGPEIERIEFLSTPQHGQDHYKDGDTIQFRVQFNTTDVVSYSLQGGNAVATKSYNDVSVSMDGVSATITAECDTTVTSITDLPVRIKAKNALGTETPDWFESTDTVDVLNGPVIEDVTFGVYPGVQTELKDNDTIQATFTFDTTNVNTIEMDGTGNNNYASSDQNLSVSNVSSSKQATVVITIDTSIANNNGGSLEPIRARARHSSQQYGNWHVSTNTLRVNNQAPTFSNPSITYPAGQQAIKSGENATVNITVNNQGLSPTYTYTGNGRSELSIPDTSTYSADKIVSYSSGTYNINSANYKLQVNRQENDKTASKTAKIFIADAMPTINITTNNGTDMRSGGDATSSMQNYNVVISSNQRLTEAPDLTAPEGTLGTFSYNSTSTTFNTTIGIHDNNARGTHTYTNLSAKNLAGLIQTNINSGDQFTIRGFVKRTLTLASQGWQVSTNVAAVNYNKVEVNWEKKSLTNRATLGDTSRPQTSTWSLDRLDPAPITVNILDSGATNASSSPTTLTIEEKL